MAHTAHAARSTVACLALATALVVPSASTAGPEDEGLLCGIELLDPLLCAQEPPPPPPPDPRSDPGGSGDTGGSGGAEAPPAGPPPTAGAAREGSPPPRVPERPQFVPNQLAVKFERRATRRQIAAVLERAGVTVEETIEELGVRIVHVPPSRRDKALARLRSSSLVDTAERDIVIRRLETRPNDSVWPEQWGLQLLGLPAAWDLTRGSSTVIVAVLDTGVDAGHPDLAGAVLPGLDLINGDGDAADDNGHGTSVAGIVAARTNNQQGQAGICWTCSILPVKVLDAKGAGEMSTLASAVVQAVDRGARVINMSLGGPAGTETLDRAVAYALAKGAVLVAAAGNNGTTTPFYPAAYPGVLAVAATDDTDHLYPWSNRGPWVRLAAPGCNVATLLGGLYDYVCGTSTAAPLVAGVAALAIAGKPSATRAEVEQALVRSAVAAEGGVSRIDALGTLRALGVTAPPAAPLPARSSTITVKGKLTPSGPSRAFPIVAGEGRLTATLTFAGTRPLTLSLLDAGGRLLARAVGRSPLRLEHVVAAAGALRLVVSARTRVKFVLKLSFPAAPAAAAPS